MLSALSANDPFISNPFSAAFDGGYTPWDCSEFFLPSPTTPKPVTSSTGSDNPDQAPESHYSKLVVTIAEERKRRRMVSNRESARRSRMRKQRHLESLRNQLNLFRVENRELNTQLQILQNHCDRVRTENDWLRSERTMLYQKLFNISQFLQPLSSAAWSCNNLTADTPY